MEPEVHYRVHISPPPIPILCHINPVHALQSISWRSILILSSHLRLGPPSDFLHSDFPSRALYARLLSPIWATCTAHLNVLYLITMKDLRHSPPVLLGLLGPNTCLRTLLSHTISLCSSLNAKAQVSGLYGKLNFFKF